VSRVKEVFKPYKAQFDRSPIWVRLVAMVCVAYIIIPIDLFDILFPWMAYSDDLFIAGMLLKLLHKYGSLPDEDKTTALELLKKILNK
jgi:uncharacterized membrane protein YkvA (DUF1232 family)